MLAIPTLVVHSLPDVKPCALLDLDHLSELSQAIYGALQVRPLGPLRDCAVYLNPQR